MRLAIFKMFFLFFISSCSSIPSYKPISNIPVSLSTKFSHCKTGDGSLKVQAKRLDMESSFVFEMDWIQNLQFLQIQAFDPLGRNFLEMKYTKADLSTDLFIRATESISSKLKIANNGEVSFDGNYLGFLVDELPCFFQGRFPIEWLSELFVNPQEISQKDSQRFYSYKDKREIQIVGSGLSQAKVDYLCADIHWSEYLGLVSRRIKICFQFKGQDTEIKISDDDNFEIVAHSSEGA